MDTSQYSALMVAGIMFALVAVLHLLRLIYKIEVTIGSKPIPMRISVIGLIVALTLSIWMFAVA